MSNRNKNLQYKNKCKGISPLISMVMLIIIVFALAGLVGPWMLDIVRSSSEKTGGDVTTGLLCSKFSLAFDSSYGTNGIEYDLSGVNDVLKAKVINTGTANAYNFSFEFSFNDAIEEYLPAENSKKTEANPLKPGQTAIISANITKDITTGALKEVKILNGVCPGFYISAKI
jgi:flagellin-like protein